MKLDSYMHSAKISPEFECQSQRSRLPGDRKRQSAAFCSGVVNRPRAASFRERSCGTQLRRWENQRILSSLVTFTSVRQLNRRLNQRRQRLSNIGTTSRPNRKYVTYTRHALIPSPDVYRHSKARIVDDVTARAK